MQIEVLDALSGPIGADFRAFHAPNFFGVIAKENLIEAAAKSIAHPLLEGLLFWMRRNLSRNVTE